MEPHKLDAAADRGYINSEEILACEEAWNHGHTAKTEDLEFKGRGALRQAATWLQKIFTFVRPYRVPKTRYAPVRHWCASLIARPPAPPPLALLFWRAVASVPLSLAADCSPNGPRPSPKKAARLTFSVRYLVAQHPSSVLNVHFVGDAGR